MPKKAAPAVTKSAPLLRRLTQLVDEAKQQTAINVNVNMSLLYWQIGHHIQQDILAHKRAAYKANVVTKVSAHLSELYGRSFTEKSLWRMIQFANVYPDTKEVAQLSHQLSWTHLLALIPLEDELKRKFYTQFCILEKWTVRHLRERINSMMFERTMISKKPEKTIRQELTKLETKQELTPDLVFRDPYVLQFLQLEDAYSEKDLETAIIAEIQRFIIELGSDFAFMARQKRISIDHRDYYIDLLFYHRRMRCLVVIDLKIGEFDAAYKGEMELYLSYLEKNEMLEGENLPVGLIMCTGKNPEHIELLQLHRNNIRVSEFATALPDKKVLIAKLKQARKNAENRSKTPTAIGGNFV